MATLDVGGLELSYDVRGSGDPVLLIPGLGQPALSWNQALAPALLEAGFEVVTFDNRGMPPSAVPPPPYTVAQMAGDAAGLLDALGRGPCHVVGFSLGAYIAEELALARPELVRSATFIAGLNVSSAYEKLRYAHELALAERLDPYPVEAAVGGVLPLLTPEQVQDDDVVTRWAALLRAGASWPRAGRIGQWSAAEGYTRRADPLARYGRIGAPALVIAFEHDADCPPARSRAAAAALSDATFLQLDGLGHLGLFEAQPQVAAAVVAFLRR